MTDWVAQWKASGEACDAHAAAEVLTEDAELVSPLTDRFSFRGQEVIRGCSPRSSRCTRSSATSTNCVPTDAPCSWPRPSYGADG